MYQPILSENNVTKVAEICAWCDSKKIITQNYYNNRWTASHGICKRHKDEILNKAIKYYENNGFKIANDDDRPNNDGLPIVRGT